MDFNNVVNRILASDLQSRARHLCLKTFSVICINEECGLLEWVNHTNCIRHLIVAAHSSMAMYPGASAEGTDNYIEEINKDKSVNKISLYHKYYQNIPATTKEFYQLYMNYQAKYECELETLLSLYKDQVLSKYHPCFHRWFVDQFPDPHAWLAARTLFTRSAATWSVIGYIIGLGDRHTENILLDVRTGKFMIYYFWRIIYAEYTNIGQCIHVDFDCIFDKGLSLQRPEIVPFRLTPNMV